MSQSDTSQFDNDFGGAPNNGNGRSEPSSGSSSRALLVREPASDALSTMMYQGAAGGFIDVPPTQNSTVQLLHAIRRRWFLALCAGLMIGLPIAALVWVVTPEKYEVEALLRVGDDVRYLNRGMMSPRNQSEYEAFRKTQMAYIKSQQVLRAALNRPGISDLPMIRAENEPLTFLQDELIVTAPMESELVRIKLLGKDKRELMKIVDAVVDSYFEVIVDAEKNGKLKDYNSALNRYNRAMEDLKNKQEKRKNLAVNSGAPNPEELRLQVTLLTQQSQTMLQQIQLTRLELSKIESKIAILEQREKEPRAPPEQLVELAISRDPQIQLLTNRLTELNQFRQLQTARARNRRSLNLSEIDAQIQAVRDELELHRAAIRPNVVVQIMQEMQRDENPHDLPQLQILRDKYQNQLTELQESLANITSKSAELTKQGANLELFDAEIKLQEATAADLSQQLNSLAIQKDSDPRVTIVQKATEPEGTKPFFRYALTIFAALAGFFLGSAAVIGVEHQARRVSTTTELGLGMGMRVLGTVPNLSSMSRSRGGKAAALQGTLAESVDSIRTILLQQSKEDAPRVIQITSAGDREGKTTVASHLAASLARSGKRTLLIDSDIRSPSTHAMFDLGIEPGLSEILRGEVAFEEAIQPTSVEGLMMIAGGRCDYQCIAALSKGHMKEVLQKARDQFDFVVIDGAPVLIYADTLLVGAHVDAAVLSVRRDISQMPKVQEARDRLESVGIRILGVVVNGINESSRRPAYALPAPV